MQSDNPRVFREIKLDESIIKGYITKLEIELEIRVRLLE